jgi:hypothetical protein
LKSGQQLYGATLDDVSNVLTNLPHMPTTRIYFDPTVPVSSYARPIETFYPISYIMGEMADSSDMPNFTVNSITTQANNLVSTLGQCVDIWEVGNEVNGNWLLNNAMSPALTMAKIEAMYNAVAYSTHPLVSKATALTFFYEGEPGDSNNCIATDNGGNDMFTWIQTNFLTSPTSETEAIRTGVKYVLISWYPDQCNNLQPNWPVIFEKLASIFPNASVGFGELGTANPENGSQYEINLINQFYPAVKKVLVGREPLLRSHTCKTTILVDIFGGILPKKWSHARAVYCTL